MRQRKEGFSKADLKLRKWLFLFPQKKFRRKNFENYEKELCDTPHPPRSIACENLFLWEEKREKWGENKRKNANVCSCSAILRSNQTIKGTANIEKKCDLHLLAPISRLRRPIGLSRKNNSKMLLLRFFLFTHIRNRFLHCFFGRTCII